MKKSFVFMTVVMASTFAIASQPKKTVIPSDITCTVENSPSPAVESFDITDLHSKEPDSTLMDTSFIDKTVKSGKVTLNFSNQCDNSYDVTMSVSALSKLAHGDVDAITARVTFFDAHLEGDENGIPEVTVKATCVITN